jgi:hypothetical protein
VLRGSVAFLATVIVLVACATVMLLSLSTEVGVLTEPASADLPMHSLEVSLFPSELTAKPTEDALGAVTFGGNLTVEKPQGVERVTVTLSGSISSGWPLVITPQTIAFINPRTERFQATVIVPPGTLASAQGVLTVTAVAKSPIWDDEATAVATVRVDQYLKMNVTLLDVSDNVVEKGGTFIGKFRINNTGNGLDTFIVEIVKGNDLLQSWDLPDPLMIPPGQFAEVSFSLTLKDDLDVGVGEDAYRTFTLRVSSMYMQEHGGVYSKDIPLYVHIMTFTGKLVENWMTYILWIAATVVVVVTPLYLWRRFRSARARPTGRPAYGDGQPMAETTESPSGPPP